MVLPLGISRKSLFDSIRGFPLLRQCLLLAPCGNQLDGSPVSLAPSPPNPLNGAYVRAYAVILDDYVHLTNVQALFSDRCRDQHIALAVAAPELLDKLSLFLLVHTSSPVRSGLSNKASCLNDWRVAVQCRFDSSHHPAILSKNDGFAAAAAAAIGEVLQKNATQQILLGLHSVTALLKSSGEAPDALELR